jgi:mRNA deadenylase 3'-5' endonuclease subunit Ccr4
MSLIGGPSAYNSHNMSAEFEIYSVMNRQSHESNLNARSTHHHPSESL